MTSEGASDSATLTSTARSPYGWFSAYVDRKGVEVLNCLSVRTPRALVTRSPTPLPSEAPCVRLVGRAGSFATTFASNPLTWFPQILASVWVGGKLMGLDFVPFVRQIEHQHVGDALHHLWSPLLLGSLVLGCIAAALGYVLAQALWRTRVLHHLRCRRDRTRRARLAAR